MPETTTQTDMAQVILQALTQILDDRLQGMEELIEQKLGNLEVTLYNLKKVHGLREQLTFPEDVIEAIRIEKEKSRRGRKPGWRMQRVPAQPAIQDPICREEAVKIIQERTGLGASSIRMYISSKRLYPEINSSKVGKGQHVVSRAGVEAFIRDRKPN